MHQRLFAPSRLRAGGFSHARAAAPRAPSALLAAAGWCASAALATRAHAVNREWLSGTSGLASNINNWSPAGLVTSNDDLLFNVLSTYTVTWDTFVPQSDTHVYRWGTVTLAINSPHTILNGFDVTSSAAPATMILASGQLNANASSDVGFAGEGLLRVTGPSTSLLLNGASTDLRVGGLGALEVLNGGFLRTDDDLILGSPTDGAHAVVSDIGFTGFQFIAASVRTTGSNADVIVGSTGDASLEVLNGASVLSGDDIFANAVGTSGDGEIRVSGTALSFTSTITATDDLFIGAVEAGQASGPRGLVTLENSGRAIVGDTTFLGADGTLVIDGGFLSTGSLDVDGALDFRDGYIEVVGGVLSTPGAFTVQADTTTGQATLRLRDGAFFGIASNPFIAGDGPFLTGNVEVIGSDVGGPSTLRVTGSTTGSDIIIADAGDATLSVASGGLVEAGDDVIFGNALSAVATATVDGVSGAHRSTLRTMGTSTTSDILVGLGTSVSASLEVINGGLVEAARDVRLGGAPAAYGEVTVGGASGGFDAELRAGDDLMVGVTEVGGEFVEQFASDAALTVNAGGTVTVGGTLAAGLGDRIEVNGGSIDALGLRFDGGDFEINGGMVSVGSDRTEIDNADTFVNNGVLTGRDQVSVSGGSMTVTGSSGLLRVTPVVKGFNGDLLLGFEADGPTSLGVTGGGRVEATNVTFGASFEGPHATSVTVSGVAGGVRSTLFVEENLHVGAGSTASLVISSGALVEVEGEVAIGGLYALGLSSVTVGGASGGFDATLDVSTGTLAAGTGFPDGRSPGLLTINSAGAVRALNTWIGGVDTGELRMTGGTLFTHDFIADGGANTILTLTGGTATVDGGTLTYDAAAALSLNGTSTSNRAMFVLQNGAQGTSADSVLVGDLAGRFGTLTVTGAAAGTPTTLTMGTGALLNIGDDGNGILNVSAGGRIVSPEHIRIGANAGSVGTATVSGSNGSLNSTLRTTGGFDDIIVGASGTGTLTASARGLVQAADQIILGQNSGGAGTATVTGVSSGVRSTLRTSGVSGSSHVIVGQSGQGTLNVQSGGLTEATHDVILGMNAGGVGTVTVGGASGGFSSELRANDDLLIGANETGANGGVGTLNLDSSGLVNVTDDTVVGIGDTLDIDGGVFNTAELLLQPGATYSQSAGVVNASGVTTSRTSDAIMTGGTYNAGGDFIIGLGSKDLASFTVTGSSADLFVTGGTLAAGVQGSGTLSVLNGGFVQASSAVSAGDSPGSLGAITVSGVFGSTRSTLDANAFVHIAPGGDGSLEVSNGAVADVAGNLLVGGVAGADGSVTVGGTAGGFNSNLYVGDSVALGGSAGRGSLTLDTFSFVTVANQLIAGSATAKGTYTINAGSLTTTDLLADNGANSVLQLNGGFTTVDGGDFAYDGSTSLSMNGTSTSNRAVLNLLSGAQGASADSILVGDGTGRFGTLNVTGFADASADRGAVSSTLTMGGSTLLHIGDDGDGILSIADSGVVQGPGAVRIGANSGSTGVATITGVGSLLSLTGSAFDLVVGGSGTGELTISSLAQALIGDDISIGSGGTGQGEVTIFGASGGARSTIRTTGVSTTSDFTVGALGFGTLDVDDGALAQSHRDFRIGDGSIGAGVVTIGGFAGGFSATMLVGDDLLIGANESFGNTGAGALHIDSFGLVQVADDTIVGAGDTLDMDGGAFGTVDLHLLAGAAYNQSGGAAAVSGLTSVRTTDAIVTGGTFSGADDFRVSTNAGDLGLFTVTGASADLLLGPAATLRVGMQGTGRMEVLAGGRVDADGAAIVGEGSNTAGTVLVSGVSGARSSMEIAGDVSLGVGAEAIGGIEIRDGALATFGDELIVGGALGSIGGVRVDGQAGGWSAELNVGNRALLGSASGGSGTLTLDHGARMTVENEIRLGFILGEGTINMIDGSLTMGSLFATQGPRSVLNLSGGEVTIDGGELFYDAAADLIVSNANVGLHASLTMRNGATGVVHDTIRVASGSGQFQSGALHLEGADVVLDVVDGADLVVGDTGDAAMSISGGARVVLDGGSDFITGAQSSATAQIDITDGSQLEIQLGDALLSQASNSRTDLSVRGVAGADPSTLRLRGGDFAVGEHGGVDVEALAGGLIDIAGAAQFDFDANSSMLLRGTLGEHRSTFRAESLSWIPLGGASLEVLDGALLDIAGVLALSREPQGFQATVGGASGGFQSEIRAEDLLFGFHFGDAHFLVEEGGLVTVTDLLHVGGGPVFEVSGGVLDVGRFQIDAHVTGRILVSEGEAFARSGGSVRGSLEVTDGLFLSGGQINNDGQIIVDGPGSILRLDGDAGANLVNGTSADGDTTVRNGALLDVTGDVVLGDAGSVSGSLLVHGQAGAFPFTTPTRFEAANLLIGAAGGQGEAAIRSGALATVTGDVRVGVDAGSQGLLEVYGAGLNPATLNIGSALIVGSPVSSGALHVLDGGLITTGHLAVFLYGDSEFNVDGGTVHFGSSFTQIEVDQLRGAGGFNFSDGLIACDGGLFQWDGGGTDFVLSGADASDNPTLHLLAGATTDISGDVIVGAAAARRGALLVDGVGAGGPSTLSTNGAANILLGSAGEAMATVSGGGRILSPNQITLAQLAGSEADVTITGSTASNRSTVRTTANTDIIVGGAGIADLTIANGGLLEARDDVTLADTASGRAFVEVAGVTKGIRSTLRTTAGSSTPDVFVGRAGIANIDVLSGALVSSARDTFVGALAGGSGDITVSGSQGKWRSELLVGDDLLLGANEALANTGSASLRVIALGRVAVTDDTILGASAELYIANAELSTSEFRMLSGAQLSVSGGGVLSTSGFSAASGADIRLDDGTLEIDGGLISIDHSTGLLDANGRLVLDGAPDDQSLLNQVATLRLTGDTGMIADGALIGESEGGALELAAGAGIIIAGDLLVGFGLYDARGDVVVSGPQSALIVDGDTHLGSASSGVSPGHGNLVLEDGGHFLGNPVNTVYVHDESSIVLAGGSIEAGLIDVREGSAPLPAGLSGYGTVDALVRSDGRIASTGVGLEFLDHVENLGLLVSDSTLTSIVGGLTNSGTVHVNSGLTVSGGVTNAGGIEIDAKFAQAAISGGVVNTGGIDVDGEFALLTISDGVIEGLGQGIAGDGQINFAMGGGFTGSGEFGQNLRINGLAGSVITATGDLTLGASDSEFGFRTNGELHVGDHLVRLRDDDDAELTGLTTLAGGTLRRFESGAGANPDIVNTGVIEGFGTLDGDIRNAAGGVIRGQASGLVLADEVRNDGVIEGDLVILDKGSHMSRGGSIYASEFVNRGEIAGGLSVFAGAFIGRGQGISGDLFIGSDGSAFLDGVVNSDVTNQGRLEIESITEPTSTLFVTRFNQNAAGVAAFDLASATDYDRLLITGDAAFSSVSGSVEIHLIDAFMPSWGARFDLIESDGFFQTPSLALDLPTLASTDLRWFEGLWSGGVYLEVRHIADIDGDNFIGFADFNIVLSSFNAPGDYSMGDVTGDGFVGFEDLNYVLSFFNTAAPGVVPSPATSVLVVPGISFAAGRRRAVAA